MPDAERLVVLGRADDMVSIDGIKFAPVPIEGRIRVLPGLRDAALIAGRDQSSREILFVVLETDMAPPPAPVIGEIKAILAGRVRSFVFRVVPALPPTETGKLRRERCGRWSLPGLDDSEKFLTRTRSGE